jgi:hypothetical protein
MRPGVRWRAALGVAAALAAGAACGPRPAGPAGEPGPAACARPPGSAATPLRGPLSPPDPRLADTLTRKGYALDAEGLSRALGAADDPTAVLAALTAVSVQACQALLPRVEALLAAPPPTAVDAAATLAERGSPAQRGRALAALRAALRDPAWPEVQITAAAYLGRAGDREAVTALRAALRSAVEALRLQAVISISAIAGFDGTSVEGRTLSLLGELDAVLADPASSWLVRREAVYQVARLPGSAEQTALLARVAASDPDERVRRAAELRLRP